MSNISQPSQYYFNLQYQDALRAITNTFVKVPVILPSNPLSSTVATITVGTSPNEIVITPNGLYAYVTNQVSNNVSVIDVTTNTVVATVAVGTSPAWVAITPNGQYAYVANYGSNNVSVIDISTNTVVATVAVGTFPWAVAVTPNGQYAYVTSYGSNNVSVIDVTSNTVVATVAVGKSPEGIAITPNGQYAYVTNHNSNNTSVIDISSNTVVMNVFATYAPNGVAITPNGQYIYVTSSLSGNVAVINTPTNVFVLGTTRVPHSRLGITFGAPPVAPNTNVFGSNIVSGIDGFLYTTITPQVSGAIAYIMFTPAGYVSSPGTPIKMAVNQGQPLTYGAGYTFSLPTVAGDMLNVQFNITSQASIWVDNAGS